MNTFVIAGPSTVTTSVGYEVGGSTAQAAGKAITLQTQCLTDTFSVTGASGSNPPIICGTNSGYHGKLTQFFWGWSIERVIFFVAVYKRGDHHFSHLTPKAKSTFF
jgi:hypothetical protein